MVFDLFGDQLRNLGGEARLQALTELLQVFDVGESTTRVVLARMRREGWFSTYRDGRQTVYSLTEKSWQLLDEGRKRILNRGVDNWDGSWRMVIYEVPEQARAEREQLRRTLAWHGFGPLATATWVTPHPRLDEIEAALAGMTASRLDLLTCRSQGNRNDRDIAARCWDLDALDRDYAELVSGYEQLPSPAELSALPGREALRWRIELVSSYRAFPFRDPDLPPRLLPDTWLGHRAHALFLAAHDALRLPAEAYVKEVLERRS